MRNHDLVINDTQFAAKTEIDKYNAAGAQGFVQAEYATPLKSSCACWLCQKVWLRCIQSGKHHCCATVHMRH